MRRVDAANYLGVSVGTLDALRLQGKIPAVVPVPAAHNDGATIRTPLFDRFDLDAAIERWKSAGGVS